MTIEPGTTLLHYRVLRRLGAGGAGEVFEAEDSRLGRRVAVKLVQPELASDPDAIERLRREARALASLAHPGIVTIYAIEEVEGRVFLVMERVEGSTLAERLRRRELSAEELLELALHLTEAMAAAHGRGVVHRDLKPGNVMVGLDGRLKVLDFGLARLVEPLDSQVPTALGSQLTQAGATLGTWHYMSPEQIRGEEADTRSDVFALGVMLYEAGAGHRPFPGPTAADVADAILRHEPAPLSQLRPDLPNSFTDLVQWCLEKDADARPSDARAVHDALAGLLRAGERDAQAPATRVGPGAGVESLPPQPPPRSRRRIRLAAVSVVALAVVAVAAYYGLRSPPPIPTAVAVLPFANLTGTPDLDHLARGIPAGLISRLGQVSGLEVLGRSESWGAAEKSGSAEQLASRLGVASLVEGELHGGESDLRVDVKLTDGSTGLVVWSQGFTGTEKALFDLQRKIATSVVRVLAVPLSRAERRRMARNPTSSLAAYALDLRAEQSLARATDPQGVELASAQFREALRRDPSFALAHAGLAEALVRLHEGRPDVELLAEADRHAHRALELDPGLGLSHVALARVARAQGHPESAIEELRKVIPSLTQPDEAYRELAAAYGQMGDLKQKEDSLRLAISSAEDYWLNWEKLGAFLLRQGRYDEARSALERSAALAPEGVKWPELNLAVLELFQTHWRAAVEAFEKVGGPTNDPLLAANMATAYFYLGRMKEAEALYRRAARLDPEDFKIQRNLGDVLQREGKHAAALSAYHEAQHLVEQRLEQTPGDAELRVWKAVYAAKAHRCPEALETAEALESELTPAGEDARALAQAYALCGAADRALGALEAAIESGIPPESIRQDDEFESLRKDARFQRLVGAAGPSPTAR